MAFFDECQSQKSSQKSVLGGFGAKIIVCSSFQFSSWGAISQGLTRGGGVTNGWGRIYELGWGLGASRLPRRTTLAGTLDPIPIMVKIILPLLCAIFFFAFVTNVCPKKCPRLHFWLIFGGNFFGPVQSAAPKIVHLAPLLRQGVDRRGGLTPPALKLSLVVSTIPHIFWCLEVRGIPLPKVSDPSPGG